MALQKVSAGDLWRNYLESSVEHLPVEYTHWTKLPEARKNDHWKGVSRTISRAHIRLGIVQVPMSQSEKDLIHGALSNVLRKILLPQL